MIRAIALTAAVKTGINAIRDCVVPSGSHTLAANAVFDCRVSLQNI